MMGPEELCGHDASDSPTFFLRAFTEEVFKLGHADAPDYSKLRFLLQKVMLDFNKSPNIKFDWEKKDFRDRVLSNN